MSLNAPLPWIWEHASQDDNKYLKIAREIAMDMRSLDEVLAMFDMGRDEWERVSSMPTFQTALKRSVSEWATATNTRDRVALKSLAMVEESLPEFYARMHDPKESLSAKTEVLKAISRFAGVGVAGSEVGMGEKLTVTINLGGDAKLTVTKDVTPRGNSGDGVGSDEGEGFDGVEEAQVVRVGTGVSDMNRDLWQGLED